MGGRGGSSGGGGGGAISKAQAIAGPTVEQQTTYLGPAAAEKTASMSDAQLNAAADKFDAAAKIADTAGANDAARQWRDTAHGARSEVHRRDNIRSIDQRYTQLGQKYGQTAKQFIMTRRGRSEQRQLGYGRGSHDRDFQKFGN